MTIGSPNAACNTRRSQPTTMDPLAPPPSHPDVLPHVGRNARGRTAAGLLLVILVALTSCTAPPDEDRGGTPSADLSAQVSEFLEQRDRNLVAVVASTHDGIDPLENVQVFTVEEAITLVQYVILAQPD